MLKDALLNTGAFKDTKQLDDYLVLVNTADTAEYLESHHIIPQKYFKLLGVAVDTSKDNIVKLSAYNHIYAHYLLCFCTEGKLNKSCIKAFLLMTQYNKRLLTEDENIAITKLYKYATLRKQAQTDINKINRAKFKGKKLSEEAKQKISAANKGRKKPQITAEHVAKLKQARDLHSSTAGKKSIYSPELNKVKFVYEAELSEYLKAGWKLGGRPLSEEAKLKIGRGNSLSLKGKSHQQRREGQKGSGLTFNRVKCVETDQIFENITEAKKWLQRTVGIDGGQIKNCCAGKRETTGGYHWKYIKEDYDKA